MKCRRISGLSEYVVSKDGHVYHQVGDKWKEISVATNGEGYKSVVLYKGGKPHFKYVHQLVADAWLDGKSKDVINHKDGDKGNVNADNLSHATAGENTKHAYKKGLAKGQKGEENGKSVLTKDQVKSIRSSDKSGAELARQYGVDVSTISLIKNGKRW